YPGIELLDSQFHSLPTQVQRGHIYATNPPRPRLVRVGPYGNAYFILEYSDVPGPGSYCPQVPYLMITVPNNNLPNVTYASGGGGHLTPCRGQVNVSPVEPTTFF
ncbi:MAG: DUF4232 domain-containing protein, partial [Chloroflexota bacterium]|nr:DUF4232 domain-containing protein [Chloroflexota bacterium]